MPRKTHCASITRRSQDSIRIVPVESARHFPPTDKLTSELDHPMRTLKSLPAILILVALVLIPLHAGAADAGDSKVVFSWGLAPLGTCQIKPEPTNCRYVVEVLAEPCRQRLVEASLNVTVTYTDNGRNDRQTFTKNWSGNACKVELTEDMGGKIIGGNVAIAATGRLSDGRVDTGGRADSSFGNNPNNSDVRSVIGNPTYAVVAYDRSKFKQFGANGLPGFDKGFGVMRLEAPDAEQVWHWRRNVDGGKAVLDAAWAAARSYPEKMRKSGYPKLPDFSERETRLFALQSLVSEAYFVPNANGRQWIPNKNRSNYADRLVEIEEAVASGKPPADW